MPRASLLTLAFVVTTACGAQPALELADPSTASLDTPPALRKSGDAWTFTYSESSGSAIDLSTYRFVLGEEHRGDHRTYFSFAVEGGPYAVGHWAFVAFDESGIQASDDGVTFVPVLDRWKRAWTSGGGLWRTNGEGAVQVEDEVRDGRTYQVVVASEGMPIDEEVFVEPWGPFAHRREVCDGARCVVMRSVLSAVSFR